MQEVIVKSIIFTWVCQYMLGSSQLVMKQKNEIKTYMYANQFQDTILVVPFTLEDSTEIVKV